jgi:cell wall assembly regulator SMI1
MTIESVIDFLQRHINETDITLKHGASVELLEQFEKCTGVTLPADIKQFYRFANGFESEEYLFNILPLEDIIDNETGDIFFAEYLIYSDIWRLEINPANADDYLITTISAKNERIVLTNSFAEFLSRFLKHGLAGDNGLCAWCDEVNKV